MPSLQKLQHSLLHKNKVVYIYMLYVYYYAICNTIFPIQFLIQNAILLCFFTLAVLNRYV